MKILVVGGAGYIGSHMLKRFQDTEHKVEVLDNLSTGFETNCLDFTLHKCDLANKEEVYSILQNNYDLVMHFASCINVGESYINPQKYYENNVVNTLNLLNCMVDLKILNFVFSSTAAVYGEPKSNPISENNPMTPVNPYGQTKAIVENILKDYDNSYGLKSISLRYFNACGAHPDGTIGERHDPETHLIPLILQVASGRKEKITIFGDDYPTKDGTCVRDYIHVMDLVEAHLLALNQLSQNQISEVYNIGNSRGFSVREIIDAAKKITGKKMDIEIQSRRKGDPAELVADNQKIKSELNWTAENSDLDKIISSAWQWEQKLLTFNQ